MIKILDPIFEVADHINISKYKNIFIKGLIPNWCEEAFVIKKVKNTVPWTSVTEELNGERFFGTFYEKELQKANQTEFRIEKVLKTKEDKLCVNWKGYYNSLNSCIYKKILLNKMSYFPEPYSHNKS